MLQYACEYFERLFIRYVSEELLAEPYLTGEACAISHRHSVSILPPSDSGDMSSNRFPSVFIGTLQHGSCVIQPTVIAFSSEELIDMIVRCGLNRLNQFGAYLMKQFKNAREDPKLLSMLKNLDDVVYSGMPISYEDEQWALKSGIRLRVRLPEIFFYLRLVDFFFLPEPLWKHGNRWNAPFR
jgi:hypothetical protein